MNHARLPKEVHLPDWACRDKQGKKGDRVENYEYTTFWFSGRKLSEQIQTLCTTIQQSVTLKLLHPATCNQDNYCD